MELQEKGLIEGKVKLVASKDCPNFRAGAFNRIEYNPRFDDVEIDRECIMFALLHERGHQKRGSFRRPIIMFFGFISGCLMYVPILIYLIYPILDTISFLKSSCSLIFYIVASGVIFLGMLLSTLFVVILFSRHFFKVWGHRDEYYADLWAAERLCKYYGINASEILDRCLRTMENINIEKNRSIKFQKLMLKYLNSHPTVEERVAFIKRHEEEWECGGK